MPWIWPRGILIKIPVVEEIQSLPFGQTQSSSFSSLRFFAASAITLFATICGASS